MAPSVPSTSPSRDAPILGSHFGTASPTSSTLTPRVSQYQSLATGSVLVPCAITILLFSLNSFGLIPAISIATSTGEQNLLFPIPAPKLEAVNLPFLFPCHAGVPCAE